VSVSKHGVVDVGIQKISAQRSAFGGQCEDRPI